MADHDHNHHHHQHRPHRLSLPQRPTTFAATPTAFTTTPTTSRQYPIYPFSSSSTPIATPSKHRLSSLNPKPFNPNNNSKSSLSFLFFLLLSLRSLYSLLPFLRSSPSFSLFPFSFLVSLLSFLLTLSCSLFTSSSSSSSKDPFHQKQNQPIFSFTLITQSQHRLLVAKSILLAVVFLLRFQALRYCGTAAMILAELSGNVAARFLAEGRDSNLGGDRNRSSKLFIAGEWREPLLEKRIPIINPATEEIVGDIAAATAEDVDMAVDAARTAFFSNEGKDWSSASGAYRAKFLRAISDVILERKSLLAKLETIDTGKPLDEAISDMESCASCFKYYAELAEALDLKQKITVSIQQQSFKTHVLKEPIGVVALITPWNYPLLMATWKAAPALAAGCTAILKPSELASVTCLELAEICRQVALPSGVLNVVTGLGSVAGAPMSSHPHVDKIAFTGSTATGIKVMTAAAQLIKPVSLELGGKSPILVFEDADLDTAAEWTIFGCFFTNGQICSATSRLLVHESIAAEFLEKLVDWSKSIKISDPMEEGCRLGAIISEGQYEKIMSFISTAKSEGATILYGGARPQHLKKGFFIEPTIITDVSTSMSIWREEIFGPVLCVKTFTTENEAIELANDTDYGLRAAVISKDLERCERFTKAVQSGIVWINCSQPCFNEAPWGGNKRSGIGRELGEWGLENYLSIKQVTHYTFEKRLGWYSAPRKQ